MLNLNTSSISININDNNININKNTTIIQACLKYNLDIPRFCFHEKLKIAGNCRMCLVEVVKSPKPVASCAMQVTSGMTIKTNTALVKKAREGVLEFLLINHPLDCPICDQGGECDLQDQVMIFGGDKGRFYEYKRSVENKNCGVFIKTLMTRCIHCTRCIRFLTDIAGVTNFGLLGRGSKVEVGTYLNKYINTEIIGNIVDLCPVGALTSKPYSFTARSWELINIETIDILDSLGADIRVDIRGTDILRILPRLNELVNSNWLTDVSRYSYDGLQIQRLFFPLFNINNNFVKVSWESIFLFLQKYNYINLFILKKKINFSFVNNDFSDSKTSLIIKDLANYLGTSCLVSTLSTKSFVNNDFKNNYLLPIHKNKLINYNFCVLIGINLRLESPLYNIFIRKLYLKKKITIIIFSSAVNLTYYSQHISLNINNFLKFLEGRHYLSNLILNTLNNSIYFILGSSVLRRADSLLIINALHFYIKNINKNSIFGVLQTKIGNINYAELGLNNGINYYNDYSCVINNNSTLIQEPLKYSFLLSLDNLNISKEIKNQFNIYIGSQSISNIKQSDVILPTLINFEKQTNYLNIENLLRISKNVFNSSDSIKEESRILLTFFYYYFNKNIIVTLIKKDIYLFNYFKYNYFFIFNKNINMYYFNYIYFIVINILFNILLNKNYIFKIYNIYLNKVYNNQLLSIFISNYYYKFYYLYMINSLELCTLKLNNFNNIINFRLKMISEIFNEKINYNIYYNLFLINNIINYINPIYYINVLNNYPFISYIDNYYKTNTISTFSFNMNLATQKFKLYYSNYL